MIGLVDDICDQVDVLRGKSGRAYGLRLDASPAPRDSARGVDGRTMAAQIGRYEQVAPSVGRTDVWRRPLWMLLVRMISGVTDSIPEIQESELLVLAMYI